MCLTLVTLDGTPFDIACERGARALRFIRLRCDSCGATPGKLANAAIGVVG